MTAALAGIIIAAYFALVFAVSWLTTRRRDRDTQTFYRGTRQSPWWVVAIAMIGTSISGVTYVSVPGMVATSQMSYMQMCMGFVVGYFAIAYLLLPLYYRLGLSSIYVYLDQRYGHSAHLTGAAFFLISKTLGCAVRMYLTAVVLQVVLFDGLGIPFGMGVACIMLIVWLYSFRGGVKTLVWTDLLQTLCLICAMVGFAVAMARAMGLTLAEAGQTISASPMSRVWFMDDIDDKRFFWKQLLGGAFTTIAMTGLDQDMMQKNLSCRSLRDAQKNMVSYGFGFLPVNFVFLSLGILLYAYAGQLGLWSDGVLTRADGTPMMADQLFPYLATGIDPQSGQPFLPTAVSVLFVLGLIAAAFSSAGSAVTALTTSVMVDFVGDRPAEAPSATGSINPTTPNGPTSALGQPSPAATDAQTASATAAMAPTAPTAGRAGRQRFWVHLGGSILMGLMNYAFHLIASGSVINAVYVIASYTYGPLLGLFFFGLFTHRAPRDRWIPWICALSPLCCWILATHSAQWLGGYEMGYELLPLNGALTAFGLWLVSLRRR